MSRGPSAAVEDRAGVRGILYVTRALLQDRHFLLAAGLLAVTALGWGAAQRWLGFVAQKQPVPWPPGVQVNANHRLLSFPTTLGPFRVVDGNDEYFLNAAPGGPHTGDLEFDKDNMDTLGIGTPFDHDRYESRCSNWYLARIYRDSRRPSSHALWQLNVFYYTGGLDTVPHIPEVCLQAAGSEVLEAAEVNFSAPDAPPPWNAPIAFNRIQYQPAARGRAQVLCDYYTFSLNGRPEASRERVRMSVADIFKKHTYFAKIEFYPLEQVQDIRQTDQAAAGFIHYALPEVLKFLPSTADVEAANARK